MEKLITPRKIPGFWELMPQEEMCFSVLMDKIEEVFKNHCFLPLDTPVLEFSDALLAKSGGETDKQVYRFCKGDTDMCMRYDLTVPLARFVAMHKNELNFPFKRYQIGKVYRGERPQKGRFREFYQCDADIIGDESLSLVADAECVNLFEKCFDALGLEIEIKLSNRKLLAGLIEDLRKSDNINDILIILDKLDKIPEDVAVKELNDLGVLNDSCQKLIEITKLNGSFEEILPTLEKMCNNQTFQTGISELKELASHLTNFGTKNVKLCLGVIRGHNYYTGTVFEGFLKDHDGAVGGGGRFENLCGYFSEKNMPGVGMSVGITRLFDILMKENYFDLTANNEIDLAVINFDETLPNALEIVSKLRQQGVKAEIFAEKTSFKSKMKEANKRGVEFVLVLGEDEVKSELYTLKNMKTGLQEKLTLDEIANRLKN